MFYDIMKNEINISNQWFSSTDLCKNPKKLGVVFPYDENENIEQSYCVSSIIDHHDANEGYWIKHTEIRDVKSKEGFLVYSKLHYATAYCIMDNKKSESVESVFENLQFNLDYTESFCLNSNNKEIGIKRDIYKEFQPLFFIDKKNITSKYEKDEEYDKIDTLIMPKEGMTYAEYLQQLDTAKSMGKIDDGTRKDINY